MSQQTPKKRVLFVRSLWPVLLVVFGVFSLLFVNLHAPKLAEAATSNTLNFQARLETVAGSVASDGNYNVQFKLYSVSSGGSALWTESYLNSASQGIRVANGYLTANLGSITAFPSTINWDQQLWITMNIGGTTVGAPTYDGEMSPRLQLTAVPYAFKAGQLAQYNSVTGFTSTLNLLQPTGGNQIFQIPDQGAAGTFTLLTTAAAATGFIQNGTSLQTSANFNIDGTGKAATFNATSALQTAGVTRVDSSGNLTNIGNISGSGTLQLSGTSGSSYIMSALGLGTTNPQSGSVLTIANGAWISGIDSTGSGYVNLFEVNSNNQIQVGAALNVDGGIILPINGGQLTFSDLPIDTSATAGTAESYTFRVGSSNVLTVYGEADGSGNLQNGRVAIGSSIAPAYTLDVGGDINTTGAYRTGGITVVSSGGILQSAALSGTYSNALSFTSASNVYYGNGANITALNGSNVASGTVAVSYGGTGAGSFTQYGVLVGNGSSVLHVTAAGGAGQCLVSQIGGDPYFSACSGAPVGVAGGDLSGTYPNPTVIGIQTKAVTITSLTTNQLLTYNGTAWVNSLLTNNNLTAGTYGNITGTGALAAGSIASGFGTITTANTITGTTLNGTTGINTGAGAGTQRIDVGGNLLNIGTIKTTGSLATTYGNVTTYENVYSYGSLSATQTGTLEIILPNAWTSTMLRFQISGYDYGASAAWRATVSGYNYSGTPAWINTSADASANAPFSTVRLAYDTSLSKTVLLLGTTATVWNYPQLSVDEVVAGFGSQSVWGSGYSSAFLTSEATITTTSSPTYSAPFVQGGNSFGTTAVLGTIDSQNLIFKTANTTRLTIDTSGNGTLTGSLTVGSTINTNTLTSTALTFSGANPIISASTTNTGLSVNANGTGTLSLDTTGAGTINLGTNATTITLGAGTGAETVNLGNSSGNDTINIGTGGGTDSITIGNSGDTITIGSNVSAGSTNYTTTGTVTAGTLNATSASGVQTSGTTRIDNAGNFSGANYSGTGTLQLSGTSGSSYIMSALGLGTTNPQAGAALTIANSSWISSIDAAGTGYINMFQVNSNNQIQVGAALNVDGGIMLPNDSGPVTLVDEGFSTGVTAGTPNSYTLGIGQSNALTVYGENNGSGAAQNVRVAIGSSITPAYTLDVGGDVNATGAYRTGGTTVISSGGVLQSASLSGTYSSALTFNNASNVLYGNGANITGLNGSNISSGTVGVTYGGTGVNGSTAANGSLLIGNGTGYSLNTLTAGTGVTITNASGSITIAIAPGGGAAGGDLTGFYPNPTIAKLQGTTVTTSSVTTGQVLEYNGTAWVNTTTTGITATGALTAGSIASGFGTITTTSTITGTTLNGTTGINTGAGAGTQRIDNAGAFTATSITNSGAYNSNTFTSTALTFGGAGAATIQSGTNQNLNIIGNGTGSLNLGATTGANSINIGNSTGVDTINIATSSGADIVNIATGPGANAINIGTSTSTTYIQGSVGIGVTGPVTPLEVNGIVRSDRTGVPGQYLQVNGGDAVAAYLTGNFTTEKSLIINNNGVSGTTTVASSIQLQIGGVNKVTLDGNGSLGIGTTGPGQRLDVQGGNINTSGSLMTANTTRIDASGNFTGGTVNTNTFTGSTLTFGSAAAATISSASNQNLTIQAPGTGVLTLTSGSGNTFLTGESLHSFTRTLPTIVNDEVDLGSFNLSNGAGSFYITVTVPSSGFSASKTYLLPITFNQTANTWVIAQPISAAPYATNDYALDVNVNAGVTSLRLRRTLGATAGVANVTIAQQGVSTDVFTPSTATSSVAAPTTYLSSAVMSQSGGGVTIQGSLAAIGITTSTLGASGVITSTVATGTAPLVVASTTKVTNLNADWLDGLDSTAFATATGGSGYIQNTTVQQAGANFNIGANGVIGGTLGVTGAITGNSTIIGTTLNGTTGINTGAGAGTLRLNAAGALSSITGYTQTSGSATFNQNAADQFKVVALQAPTTDMVNISNASFPTVTAGTNGIQVDFYGGAAAIEASAARFNVTPGTTSGGVWNAQRVVVAAAATGVTSNAIKLESTAGAGTQNGLYFGTGWDNLLNYNGQQVLTGTGLLNSYALSGTYSNIVTFSNASNSFTGVGTGLTALNGTNISSGTVANARLVGAGALTVTAGNGLTGGGSVALGGTTTLTVGAGSCITVGATTVGVTAGCVDAATVGGLGASGFIQNTTSPQASSNFNISGTGVIGGTLTVAGTTSIGGALIVGANSAQGDFVQFSDTFDGSTINTGNWTVTGAATQSSAMFVTGTSSWTTRGVTSTQAYRRSNSLTLTTDVITPATTAAFMVGFSSATTMDYANMSHAIYFASGTLQIYENGVQKVANAGSYSVSSTYRVRIAVNATGARYYLSSNGGDTWTQLYDGTANNITNSPLYARFDVFAATTPAIDNLTVSNGQDVFSNSQFIDKGLTLGQGNLQSASATALTITGNASSTWSTSSGVLTLQGAGGVVIDALSAGLAIANSAIAHTVNIATGAAVQGITIGSTNSTSSLLLQAGTGNLQIQTQGGTLGLGNNSVAQSINIGNITGATAINEKVGTGNYTLDGVAGSTYAIGASTTTGTITIGGTAQTGAISIGTTSGTSQTLNLGVNSGATGIINLGTGTGTQTIHLGDGGTGAKTVTVGSTASTSTTLIQGVTSVNINGAAATTYAFGASTTTGTITIGGTAQTGAISIGTTSGTSQTLNLGVNSGATGIINLGTGTGTQTIHLGDGGTGAKTVTVGSTASTSSTTIQAGTGTVLIQNQGTGAIGIANNGVNSTVNIGKTGATANTTAVNIATSTGATQTIAIGGTGLASGSAAGTTIALQGGATAQTITNAGVTIQTFTNSATAFQVENSAGVPVFLVDTTVSQSGNYLTNGGFEIFPAGTPTTATGWASVGSPTTFSRNTAAPNHYGGLASMQVTTTAVGGQGGTTTSFNSAPGAGTYTVSFYVLLTSGSMTSANFQTSVNGGAAVACTSGVTLTSGGFVRVICPVTAGATITSLSIQQTTAGAAVRTFYLDGVQLVAGTSATPATAIGAIQLRGAVDSPAVFQALSNSTTAFQIQNTAGTSNLFVADTLNNQINIGGGLNVGTSGQFKIDSSGNFQTTGTGLINTSSATAFQIQTGSGTPFVTVNTGANPSLVAQGSSTALFSLQSSTGALLALNSSTRVLTIGSAAAGGVSTVYTNFLQTHSTTITAANASANQTIQFPDASGTLCLDSGNCSAAGGYIVNGTSLQTGSFNINGTGTANDLVAGNSVTAGAGGVSTTGNVLTVGIGLYSGSGILANVHNANALLIQNGSSVNLLSADTINQRITVGAGTLVSTISYASNITYTTSVNPTFAAKTDYADANNPNAIAAGDFNGDGILDYAVTHATVSGSVISVSIGTGNGTYATKVDYATGNSPTSIVAADFNGDGNLDLAVANNTSFSISVFIGTGTGTFAAKVDYVTGNNLGKLVAADFNGDGKPDLAVILTSAGAVHVRLNSGTGTFPSGATYSTTSNPTDLVAGDFTGDGKPDLAVTNGGATNTVSVFINSGTGTFAAKVDYATGSGARGITTADFNSDTKLDLAVTNITDNTVSILNGSGTGTFAAKVDYPITMSSPNHISTADFNGDGKPDLVVQGSGTAAVLPNSGTGTFPGEVDLSGSSGSNNIIAVDFNGDTVSDFAMTNSTSGSSVSIFINTSAGLVGSITAPSSSSYNNTSKLQLFADASYGGVVVQGASGQTGNMLTLQDSGGNQLLGISASGATTFKNNVDSAAAFQIQNATGSTVFGVNTSARVVTVAGGLNVTGNINLGGILVLGSSVAEPSETDGAIYYNSSLESFRCGMNTVWRSCVGGLAYSNTAVSTTISNSAALTNFSLNYTTLANDCQPGVVYRVTAAGVYSTTTTAPTLALSINLDGTTTQLATSGTMTTVLSAVNAGWQVTGQMICDGSNLVETQGVAYVGLTNNTAGLTANTALMAKSGTTAFTTNTTHTLNIGAKFGTANASNTITLRQLVIERVGP